MLLPIHLSTMIIEPDLEQNNPYQHLPDQYTRLRCSSLDQALDHLKSMPFLPDFIIMSTNFPAAQVVDFLEQLVRMCDFKLIPLIFTVDFSHRKPFIPGTGWGGQIGVLCSFSGQLEVAAVISRLFPMSVDKMEQLLSSKRQNRLPY